MTSWKIHDLNEDVFFRLNMGFGECHVRVFRVCIKAIGSWGTRFGGLYPQAFKHILVEVEVKVVRCDYFSCVFLSYWLRICEKKQLRKNISVILCFVCSINYLCRNFLVRGLCS